MTQLELINYCANRFNTGWAGRTEVEWPNVASSHSSVPYVRFSVVVTTAENGTIGITSRTKFTGYIIVQIFVKTNTGYKTAYDHAQEVFNIMENAQFDGVITYAGEVVELGEDLNDSDLFVINAQVPFHAL